MFILQTLDVQIKFESGKGLGQITFVPRI